MTASPAPTASMSVGPQPTSLLSRPSTPTGPPPASLHARRPHASPRQVDHDTMSMLAGPVACRGRRVVGRRPHAPPSVPHPLGWQLRHDEALSLPFLPAAKTYVPEKHEMRMDEVTTSSLEVKQWLEDHHNLLWARSKFDCDIKCEYINNNLAKSWNSWIKELKDLPVDALVDVIREKTLILFEKRRRISRALNGVILPAVIH
ncbi:hypothetical protein E2562_016160 [Oryza meyeriana var. granulata]|uniref:Uncharacterized protein n=1 Tax=Oryza meyeriana var. granulata TaxID=110450 RepID=A0A6G1F8P8_9ORYZ|nr:hypothetical protein E2562_016160 [Oryza meyeriana var. granulata]